MDIKDVFKILSEYVEFNIEYLFDMGDPIIFGGCLRDIISGDYIKYGINDVDIACCKETMTKIQLYLLKNGYVILDKYKNINIQKLYEDIHIIHEPITLVKNNKIIQLIRPRINTYEIEKKVYEYTGVDKFKSIVHSHTHFELVKFINEVDLSCCGIFISDTHSINESFKNSILHSKNRVYQINKEAKMITNRLELRSHKLNEKNWRMIDEHDNRNLLIDVILDEK